MIEPDRLSTAKRGSPRSMVDMVCGMAVYGPLLVCKLTGLGFRGTTAHVYPASYCCIEYSTSGHNGLFARQLPIACSALMALDILGFVRRRFDL